MRYVLISIDDGASGPYVREVLLDLGLCASGQERNSTESSGPSVGEVLLDLSLLRVWAKEKINGPARLGLQRLWKKTYQFRSKKASISGPTKLKFE